MRVLHVLDHSVPLHSGYSFRTLSILRQQRALGWETFQLTGPRQGTCESQGEDVEGLHFERTMPPCGLLSDVPLLNEMESMGEMAHRIESVAQKAHVHLLHAHSPVLNALPSLRVARRLGVPLVYEVRAFWEDAAVDHGTTREGSVRYRATRMLETFALRRADAVVTICDGLRSEMIGRGIAPDKITVVPNAVSNETLATLAPGSRDMRRELGLGSSTVLGFIGSFYAYEGIDLLIEAAALLLRSGTDLRVLLVGGAEQEEALKRLAEKLGVQDRVIFVGRVPHADVPFYYGAIDVLVYPRRRMRLTELVTPLKPLEAMAQGRLLVASDVGGHRELIRDGQTGILFEAGNVQDLAAKLEALLANPAMWASIRQQARAYVERERTWQVSVQRYAPVYERLLAKTM